MKHFIPVPGGSIAATLSMLVIAAAAHGVEPLTYKQTRVAVTGHDVNRPDPFPGLNAFGWAGNIQRLEDGAVMLVHTAGYDHVSFAEPRLIEETTHNRWLQEGWPLDYPAPTGGRSMSTISRDGGATWSTPRTIVDLEVDDGAYGLLRCKDGTLLCFINVQASWYGYAQAPPAFRNDLGGLNTRQCVVRSLDGGRTWSEPVWLDSPGKFYERSHAQPIQLPDGGILWPTYSKDTVESSESGVIHRSDDSGRSWRTIATVRRNGKAVDEPAIARLNDDRLIMVCRPDGATFRSDDDGVTWNQCGRVVDRGRFKAPSLHVLSDNTVVCVATLGTLHVFLSTTHGKIWTAPIALDPSSYG